MFNLESISHRANNGIIEYTIHVPHDLMDLSGITGSNVLINGTNTIVKSVKKDNNSIKIKGITYAVYYIYATLNTLP